MRRTFLLLGLVVGLFALAAKATNAATPVPLCFNGQTICLTSADRAAITALQAQGAKLGRCATSPTK